jgi:hypothetical protein
VKIISTGVSQDSVELFNSIISSLDCYPVGEEKKVSHQLSSALYNNPYIAAAWRFLSLVLSLP